MYYNLEKYKMIGVAYLVVVLLDLFLLIKHLFVKSFMHYKLLKEIYPTELRGVNSYLGMMFSFSSFALSVSTLFWFWTPIYFKVKCHTKYKDNAIIFHKKLVSNNRYIIRYFLFYICLIAVLFLFE
tara:strand:- start:271 stop:648 length:378 start_codon:yes stop_codon:yes gene_type:complete